MTAEEPASSVQLRFSAGSRLGALVTIALGLAGLAGWAFELPLLTSVLPGLATMKANAAASFVLLGAALLLLQAGHRLPRRAATAARPAALVVASLVVTVAALTLSQDLLGWSLGLDQALFHEAAGAVQTTDLGRMSPGTAAAFILAGASLALLALEARFAPQVAQTLAALVGAIALTVLMGYLLDVQALYRVRAFSATSLNTAVAFLVLALALQAARAESGWMREFSADTTSARLARRLALAMLVAMVAVTLLTVHGKHFGWFGAEIGAAVHAVAGFLATLMLLWLLARFANRTELRAARLARVRAILGFINALITRTRDPQALLKESCRIAVDLGGYQLAWIGLLDREAAQIVPAACAGPAGPLLEKAATRLARADATGTPGPAQRAMASGKPVIITDIRSAAGMWFAADLAQLGVRSLAMLPLVVAGEARGVFALHSRNRRVFDGEETTLLAEVAGDIAFALDHIEKEQRLGYLALHDTLTRLANRALFMDRLAQHLAGAARAQGTFAVLLIDVSRFRQVNAAFGRHVGDEVLREIGARLERAHEPARLARIGGDVFAILVPRLAGAQDAVRLYERIAAECFGPPFTVGGEALALEARAGIATFPDSGTEGETLFRSAESALIEAKHRGERYAFHDPATGRTAAARLRLETGLRSALANRELLLHYQPKVDVRTRAIAGAEALMRWRSPDAGLIPPAEFVPLLEETGLIVEAGAWALGQAAADARRLREAGVHELRVAVNVSARQLREPDFARLAAQVAGSDPGPEALELEITESAAMENVEQTRERLRATRALGFALAIDDFGTGYCSLAYLTTLPVQSLKIDRSFVSAMLEDVAAARVVRTIIDLAHSLGLTVVAEGVETQAQATALAQAGCDQMQGWLISKPLPYGELERFVRRPAR